MLPAQESCQGEHDVSIFSTLLIYAEVLIDQMSETVDQPEVTGKGVCQLTA